VDRVAAVTVGSMLDEMAMCPWFNWFAHREWLLSLDLSPAEYARRLQRSRDIISRMDSPGYFGRRL